MPANLLANGMHACRWYACLLMVCMLANGMHACQWYACLPMVCLPANRMVMHISCQMSLKTASGTWIPHLLVKSIFRVFLKISTCVALPIPLYSYTKSSKNCQWHLNSTCLRSVFLGTCLAKTSAPDVEKFEICLPIVVNHNKNTKYLKNSNPKYFIGSCLKNKRKL